MRLPPHPLSFIQIGDKGLSHRGEFIHHVLVAVGESLVIAAMALFEEGIECLAMLNSNDSFGYEMQAKHGFHASMRRSGNMMFQEQGLYGIEAGIIETIYCCIVVAGVGHNPCFLHRLVSTLQTVVYETKTALFIKRFLHILMPSFITLI